MKVSAGLEETTDSTIRNDKNFPDWQKNLKQTKCFSIDKNIADEIDFSSDKYISRPAKVSQFSITFVRYKIKWNGNFRKVRLENFDQLLEVVLFSGNLEMLGIFCSIGDFISIGHSAQPGTKKKHSSNDWRCLYITMPSRIKD